MKRANDCKDKGEAIAEIKIGDPNKLFTDKYAMSW